MADQVNHPDHYKHLPLEAIDIIRLVLNQTYGPNGFAAYCFGAALKYRLRAGKKGDAAEDLAKADKYMEFLSK